MTYALGTGMLVAFVAWAFEMLARTWRFPARGIWAAAMTVMLVLGSAAVTAMALPFYGASIRVGAEIDGTAGTSPSLVPNNLTIAATAIGHARERSGRVISTLAARLHLERQRLDSLNAILLALWAACSVMLAGVAVYALRDGRRLRRGLEPAQVEGVSVLLTETIGPATLGMRFPEILLPRWALDLDQALLRLVLRHEREHLEARDPLLLLFASLVVVLLPWHLPLWWSWRRLRLAIEVDCDARVLRTYPHVRRYAELLLLTGQRGAPVPWPRKPTFVIAAPLRPHVSHLTTRIHIMTQHASRPITRSIVLVGAVVASATVALAVPAPQRSDASSRQRAEIAGLYWMLPPDVPSMRLLAPGREFTYIRLAADGRSRLENVMVDASGERISPTVTVADWSTQLWKVIPASEDKAPQLCWELGSRLICNFYQRDPQSGDITMYSDSIGGRLELVLRRASGR
jgi:beta-lactamase regulating signal transducer with metallopeptidase domain